MKSNTIGCVSGNSAGLAMRMVSPTGGLNVINIVVVRGARGEARRLALIRRKEDECGHKRLCVLKPTNQNT